MAMRAFRLLVLVTLLLPALAVTVALPAAAQTFDEAAYAYMRGDDATAVRGFRRLAEQGDASAQFSLGKMYGSGRGVSEDQAEAMRWYRRAAEQGHAEAQFFLGVLYRRGAFSSGRIVVPADHVEAVRWLRRAAKQRRAEAQLYLGYMYEEGRGVPKDHVEAVRWYRRAAGQGFAEAQYYLGIVYANGRGISRDLIRAYKWYSLAASQFSGTAKLVPHRAVRDRDLLARRLTPAQLARAQRLARQWRPRKEEAAGAARPVPRVAAIQRALTWLGYDPGPADGVAGPRTRAAIRALQASAGQPADGRVSFVVVEALRTAVAARRAAAAAPRRALKRESTGSGFRVSVEGHILTNAHVVHGCTEVRVTPAGGGPPRMAADGPRDEVADLALLKGPAGAPFAAFRRGRGVRPGAAIVVVGYPLYGLLAERLNVSTGNVAALAGLRGDRSRIQITAPVQKGNSGGPVLDRAGNIVGVVVSKLDALKVARAIGSIPQNVNFAVSAGVARAFLRSEGVKFATAPSDEERAPDEVADLARPFTVLVECWK